jgi:hypothetical protein
MREVVHIRVRGEPWKRGGGGYGTCASCKDGEGKSVAWPCEPYTDGMFQAEEYMTGGRFQVAYKRGRYAKWVTDKHRLMRDPGLCVIERVPEGNEGKEWISDDGKYIYRAVQGKGKGNGTEKVGRRLRLAKVNPQPYQVWPYSGKWARIYAQSTG